ncbi:MAG: cyclic nucleotide-binding domain-containing protein, partial [bacterium]
MTQVTQKTLRDKYPSAFPKLTPAHLKIIAGILECVTYHDRHVLIRSGDTGFKCHVIKKGEIEIIDVTGNEPTVIMVHGPNEFTGDLTNLAGRSSNMDIVARGTIEVYEISYEKLWSILNSKPELSEILLSAFTTRSGVLRDLQLTGLRVIGPEYSSDTFRITNYLTRNRIRFTHIDSGSDLDPKVKDLLDIFKVKPEDLPVVAHGNSWMLYNPTNTEIAEKIGLKKKLREIVFDLAIVGAGPAGLAAGVYGASEGLVTVILESVAAGGQAATSSKIENYLGFPMGISGADLA